MCSSDLLPVCKVEPWIHVTPREVDFDGLGILMMPWINEDNYGECPESFEGWFETFPLNDLNVISEVEPPARIIGSVLEQPGIFRLPYWQNDVEVRMPIDATLVYGLKYLLTSNLNDANPDGLSDFLVPDRKVDSR